MTQHRLDMKKAFGPRRWAGWLAVALFAACVSLAASPAVDGTGRAARAAQGAITLSATILAPAGDSLPLTNLQATAQTYVITASWTNPAVPYSGALIEWSTAGVRRGTPAEETWREFGVFYPPAGWARLAAPLGARYTVEGSAFYDGGAAVSRPATASVVLTAPVVITSSFPATGLATTPALIDRFGASTYESPLRVEFAVPGGAENLSMGSRLISWSPQLASDPELTVYRIDAHRIRRVKPGSPVLGPWKVAPRKTWSLTAWTRESPLTTPTAFVDGYPAYSDYRFAADEPGLYKLQLKGVFADGFEYKGSRSWTVTRYVTLSQTRYTSKLTVPKVVGKRSHKKKLKFTATVLPQRPATFKLTIQRRLHGKWRAYKTVTAKSGSTGTWIKKTRIKRKGLFRVRATIGVTTPDVLHEYSAATSRWRRFRVR